MVCWYEVCVYGQWMLLDDELMLKLYNFWSLNLYLQMYFKSLFISSQVKVRKEFWNVAVELSVMFSWDFVCTCVSR